MLVLKPASDEKRENYYLTLNQFPNKAAIAAASAVYSIHGLINLIKSATYTLIYSIQFLFLCALLLFVAAPS